MFESIHIAATPETPVVFNDAAVEDEVVAQAVEGDPSEGRHFTPVP